MPDRAVDAALRAATSPAGDATRGLGTRTISYRVVRTGAGAYAYNWHVDYAHNWIADLSGGDFRVVLTHPALPARQQECDAVLRHRRHLGRAND